MKYLTTTVIGILSILFLSNFSLRIQTHENHNIEVYFSNKLTLADLAKTQSELSAKSIKLNYDYLRFGSDGKLTEIEYHVSTEKFGASDKSTNTEIELGFIINTDPNPKFGIIAGTKEQIQKRLKALEN